MSTYYISKYRRLMWVWPSLWPHQSSQASGSGLLTNYNTVHSSECVNSGDRPTSKVLWQQKWAKRRGEWNMNPVVLKLPLEGLLEKLMKTAVNTSQKTCTRHTTLQTHWGLSVDTWPPLIHLIRYLAPVTTSTWSNVTKPLTFMCHLLYAS